MPSAVQFTLTLYSVSEKTFPVYNMFKCVSLCFSSVHMEESSVMQGAQGVLVQNWPTASSAAGKNLSCYFHLNQSKLT